MSSVLSFLFFSSFLALSCPFLAFISGWLPEGLGTEWHDTRTWVVDGLMGYAMGD